jgi:hypothetical protein
MWPNGQNAVFGFGQADELDKGCQRNKASDRRIGRKTGREKAYPGKTTPRGR